MTIRGPVIVWRNEMRPHDLPSPEPPPVPFTVTRSEVVQGTATAPVVHIWYGAIPDVPVLTRSGNTAWLREHGSDLIPVRLIDLLGAVTRMEQVYRELGTGTLDITHERIFTCDLPRLRRYLPDGAQAVLAEEGW